MMKMVKTYFIFFLFLAGCGGGEGEAGMPLLGNSRVEGGVVYSTPILQATSTPVPTATVDWQGTAVIAQQTADEARRLNTLATAEYEQRIQEQIRLTAEQDARLFEAYGWTATAALTSIPATATQQSILNTQIADQQALMVVQITQTSEAPAKLIEMQVAEDRIRYAPLENGLRYFVMFAFGVACLFLASFTRKMPHWNPAVVRKALEDYVKEEQKNQPAVRNEAVLHPVNMTHVQLKDEAEGYSIILKFTVPCSPDALTELAQALVSGEKTFGINSWEGSESENFSRKLIKAVRHFLQLNKFAESVGGGRLHLTDLGRRFLTAWLESRNLPAEYSFEHAEGVK